MSQTKTVTDQSFEEDVLSSVQPVLVDYWAEWCGPCRMVGPIVEESAVEYGDRLAVAKLNIDENPKTPSRYNVRGIPTLMLFKDGHPIATHVGSLSRSQLAAFIDKHTSTEPSVAEARRA
jgi:thioredoxin 1